MRAKNEIDGIDLDWREDEDFDEMIFRGRRARDQGRLKTGQSVHPGQALF